MRYILATTLLMTVGMTSSASAGCGPAVQNWQNGSKTTCTYDSNGGVVEVAAPAPAAPPPPPTQVEENCHENGGYEGYGGYGKFKSFKSRKSSRWSGGNET